MFCRAIAPIRILCYTFAAMDFTLEKYKKLKEAAFSGILTVNYGDKTITYRSLADMLKLLDLMECELFPERYKRRRGYFQYNRGYNGIEN